MRKISSLLTIIIMLLAVRVHADMIPDVKGGELFQVFNTLFFESEDQAGMGSNIELLQSGYLMSDGSDLAFGNAGDTLRIDLTFRESGFGGTLGIWNGINDADDSGYQTLVGGDKIEKDAFSRQDRNFTMPDGYTFADTRMENGEPQQRWSADRELNALGTKDHFLAFAIDDDALLETFNRQLGTFYTSGVDDVWLIAFEELNLGDADYNDLVAVVSRPADLNPIPAPGAALLMFSGLAGVVGMRLRRSAG